MRMLVGLRESRCRYMRRPHKHTWGRNERSAIAPNRPTTNYDSEKKSETGGFS